MSLYLPLFLIPNRFWTRKMARLQNACEHSHSFYPSLSTYYVSLSPSLSHSKPVLNEKDGTLTKRLRTQSLSLSHTLKPPLTLYSVCSRYLHWGGWGHLASPRCQKANCLNYAHQKETTKASANFCQTRCSTKTKTNNDQALLIWKPVCNWLLQFGIENVGRVGESAKRKREWTGVRKNLVIYLITDSKARWFYIY